MNLKVMYVPWNDNDKLFEAAQGYALRHNAGHRLDRFSLPVAKHGPKSLKGVLRIQQLYICVAWNNGDFGGVGSQLGGGGNSLQYSFLAEQLREDGLTTAIRKVKIMSTAEMLDSRDPNFFRVNFGETRSAAYRLKEAMAQKGFNNVEVFGYRLNDGKRERYRNDQFDSYRN